MSFRTRLTLFFALIVILPMIAVAIVLSRLVGESETGKADARVSQGQVAAFSLFDDSRRAADGALRRVGSDRRLLAALRASDLPAARARSRRLLRATGAARIAISTPGGRSLAVGDAAAVAPRRTDLIAPAGGRVGRVEVSVTTARQYVRRVQRFTTFDAVVARGGRTLASTAAHAPGTALPDHGEVKLGGTTFRAAGFDAPDFGGRPARVTVLLDADAAAGSVHNDRLVLGAILLGFLLLSCLFALGVSRALQSQIGRFLHAARRIGEGDFEAEVPTDGRDEFSELGREFNKMSVQLAGRLEEVRQERVRLRTAILRTGQAAASGLDGNALLDNVVRTAVDGVQAACGRALMRGPQRGPLEQRASAGEPNGLEDTLRRAEGQALDASAPSEVSENGGAALAFPLRESAGDRRVLGLVSVARAGERFSGAERELFNSLAGQAARGVENVELHQRVSYQAIHDELTGLANHRRFQEFLDAEMERARRFEQDTALILLDIDDFKRVNDTWGHQQGDLVLQQVARVLTETSREIDEPARYGGEEMVVALPQTDIEGAHNLAERMRRAIEELELPLPGGGGVLRVTASFGVASFPGSAVQKDELIAAADAALYEAKRTGKNRTVRAVRL